LCNFIILMAPTRGLAHANNESGKIEQATARDARDEQASVRCQEDLRLVASVFNEQRPQLSLAVVRNRDGARMLALGGRLDNLVLVALQPDYVELRSEAGERCILSVFDPSARAAPAAPSARPAAQPTPEPPRAHEEPAPRAMFTQEELSRGLRSLADGSFVLTRELLLKALKNPGGAASGAHFRLLERDGRGVGMEVRAVREGSALSRMGLRSGDVIKSINGIEVTNPLGLLEVLRAARSADSVTLSIVHDGKERALRYRIE
jgi:general secretion pathway protein C